MKVKRQLRMIERAISGHGYVTKRYTELEDGKIVFAAEEHISIEQTRIRRKDIRQGKTAWEEFLPGCNDWFRCDAPMAELEMSAPLLKPESEVEMRAPVSESKPEIETFSAKDYQKSAIAFNGTYDPLSKRLNGNTRLLRLLHSIMGMSSEVGETTDAVKRHLMYNQELDIDNLKEECGDILWYMNLMLTEIGSSFEEVMKLNIEKLSKRYPQGFTEAHAKLRLDKQGGTTTGRFSCEVENAGNGPNVRITLAVFSPLTPAQRAELTVGSIVRSSRNFDFELVFRNECGKESWKDLRTGIVWHDREDERYTYRKAFKKFCSVLPTIEEFELAEIHGFRDVLPNMNYWFRSISPPLAVKDRVLGFDGQNGCRDNDYLRYFDEVSVRCVDRKYHELDKRSNHA